MISINLDLPGTIIVFCICSIFWVLSITKKSQHPNDVFIALFFTIAVLISLVWVLKLLVI